MSMNQNITVLTFCDSDRLFSLLLSKKKPPYDKHDGKLADEAFEVFDEFSLNIESIKDFSTASNNCINLILTSAIIFIMRI